MTSIKELKEMVQDLNEQSKCRYALNINGEGVRLVLKYPKGGEMNLSNRLRNKDIENILSVMLSYLNTEKDKTKHATKTEAKTN